MTALAILGAIAYLIGWAYGGYLLMCSCEGDPSMRRSRGYRDYTPAEAGAMILLTGWAWPLMLVGCVVWGLVWLIGKAARR